jgi:hypothetical protein
MNGETVLSFNWNHEDRCREPNHIVTRIAVMAALGVAMATRANQ